MKHGIEVIVSAMTAHSNVPEVQEWGCLALANFACSEANFVSIAANHDIEATMIAVTAHSNVCRVNEWGA
jgi:hypothetical protein